MQTRGPVRPYILAKSRLVAGATLFGLLGVWVSTLNLYVSPDWPVWVAYAAFGVLVGALPPRVPVLRVALGAAVFSGVGFVVLIMLSWGVSHSEGTIYQVMAGFGLFGTLAGVFARGTFISRSRSSS